MGSRGGNGDQVAQRERMEFAPGVDKHLLVKYTAYVSPLKEHILGTDGYIGTYLTDQSDTFP